MNKEKAIPIISGGMDSVTLFYWALKKYEIPMVLSFNYGSRHNEAEIRQAKWQCAKKSILHKTIDLQFLGKDLRNTSALLNSDIEIPEGHYSDDKMKVTVVPNRNMVMLSLAAAYAEDNKVSKVLLGSHQGDRAQYPDCREEFTQAASLASMLGTYERVKIISPFNNLFKQDIVGIGMDLGVDYSHTNTCYKGDAVACMASCSTCLERVEAFMLAGYKDPLYTLRQWEEVVEKCKQITREFEGGE